MALPRRAAACRIIRAPLPAPHVACPMTSTPAPAVQSASLSYEQSGVNYDLIDPLKVSAQRAAAATAVH